ncbi:MAG: ribosome maturation factor RimP [Endomicrobiia bacterium]
MSEIIKEIEKLIEPVLTEEKFELVDIEYRREPSVGLVLRIYIDHISEENLTKKSVTLDDCQKISEKVGFLLDKEDLIKDSYILEVSSPGLNRKLKKEKDFLKFINSKAKIKLYGSIEGQKNFIGYIKDCKDNILTFLTEDKKELKIRLDQISDARLEPDIKF